MRRRDIYLYFHNISGTGTISCLDCNYKQEIVGFLHGFGKNAWSNTGYQCQKCGKFHEIIGYSEEELIIPECDCGGQLSRSKHLFCPRCKMTKVTYRIKYMT